MHTIQYNGWKHSAINTERILVEWAVGLSQNFSIKFEVGDGDGNRDISVHFGLPFIATLYVNFKNVHPYGWPNRQFKVAYHDSAFRIDLWSTVDEWNSKDPWWTRGVSFYMPWMWSHLRHEILDDSRNVVFSKKDINFWERLILRRKNPDFFETHAKMEEASKTVSKEFDFTYTLKSGEVQKRRATCHLERRTWCWRWIPCIKMNKTSMDVAFDGEVGERSGSWKGGTVGCGYDILPGETMEQCLRRMEKERKF